MADLVQSGLRSECLPDDLAVGSLWRALGAGLQVDEMVRELTKSGLDFASGVVKWPFALEFHFAGLLSNL